MKKFTKFLSVFVLVALFASLAACEIGGEKEHKRHRDTNHDCYCDVCNELMDTHVPNAQCVCETCGRDFHSEAAYNIEHVHNLVCDVCGRSFEKIVTDYSYKDPATCEHEDLDSNCVCDKCFTSMGHEFENGVCKVCGNKKRVAGDYTYTSTFSTSPSDWNPHTYQTADDGDVYDLIATGLYGFYFDGNKTGYEIWPEMASAYPEDVTEEVKAMAYNFGIPEDATEHYAYKIRLNKNAKWNNGQLIKAYDWVESFKLLMDPDLQNYRAADQMSGNVVVANCKNYFYQGRVEYKESMLDYQYEVADLEKGADGQYYSPEGKPMYIGIAAPLAAYLGGNSLKDYVDYYGVAAIFDSGAAYSDTWAELLGMMNEGGCIPLTDDTLAKFIFLLDTPGWGEDESYVPNYLFWADGYEDNFPFEKVGMFVDPTDEYAFYMVLEKPAFGFYYIYGLGAWLVNVDAYKALMVTDPVTGEVKTTYNSSLETTYSYGPYMLNLFQLDKEIDYVRNEQWFGYSDERYDCLYQTSAITQAHVTESSTRKEMFLKGEILTYGLQTADYEDYGSSNWLYTSPGTTLFFMILAANESVLESLQTEGINKTMICNESFRHAMSLAFNKGEFSSTVSPARAPAYSVIGAYDIWNPTTGERYRDTKIAKEALVEFYGYVKGEDGLYHIEGSDFAYTLNEANDAINGYSPDVAKVLFNRAYDEWVEAGKYNGTDIIEIEYASSSSSDFITKMLNELNRQLSRTLEGTKLEGKVVIKESAPYGNEWSTALKNSQAQTCLCGWRGGMLDPFGTMLYYLEPDHDPYAEKWWHTEAQTLTLTLPVGEDGADVDITTTLSNWSLLLTGEPQTINGVEYNFGYAQVADEVRLTILAAFEKVILGTDYYIPFMQDGSGFLLSKKVQYALGREEYNAVLGRGGIAYMTYNYNDAQWAEYVAAQGGTLTY